MAPLSERVSGMIAKGMVNLSTQGAVLPLERCQLEVWQSCGPLIGGQNMQPPQGPTPRCPRPPKIILVNVLCHPGRHDTRMGPGEGGESISQE